MRVLSSGKIRTEGSVREISQDTKTSEYITAAEITGITVHRTVESSGAIWEMRDLAWHELWLPPVVSVLGGAVEIMKCAGFSWGHYNTTMNNGPIVPTVSVCLCVSRELNTIDSPVLTGKKYVRYTRFEAFLRNSMSRDLKHNLILWGHLNIEMIRNILGRSGSSRRRVPRRSQHSASDRMRIVDYSSTPKIPNPPPPPQQQMTVISSLAYSISNNRWNKKWNSLNSLALGDILYLNVFFGFHSNELLVISVRQGETRQSEYLFARGIRIIKTFGL